MSEEEITIQTSEQVRKNKKKTEAAKRRARKKLIKKTAVISCCATLLLVLLIYGIFSLVGRISSSNISSNTSSDDTAISLSPEVYDDDFKAKLKNALNGNSAIAMLKELYPENIVVVSNSKYYFCNIDPDIPKNDYDIDNLVETESGEYQYVVDDQVVSKKGIDVSSHQEDIDWTAVAEDGVEFAFLRAGFRGYGTGSMNEDTTFKANLEGAKAAGIDTGVYFFSQAITVEEAIEEADFVVELLDGQTLELPIVYDVEKVGASDARADDLTKEERTEIGLAFMSRITELGYTPAIYHNTEMGALLIDIGQFMDYDIWFAGYNKEFYWPYRYKYWQYSDTGTVSGIDKAVDLDLMMY